MSLGPLTMEGTNVIVGIVQLGWACARPHERRVGVYQDVLKSKAQAFIRSIVPDVEIA